MTTREFLENIMGRYTTENVEDPIAFEKRLHEFFDMNDWEMEGYSLEEKHVQREKSINFRWGHNHDFDAFQLEGILGDRHIGLIEKFIEIGLPKDLYGNHILDVGVWCGGTSLLLVGMNGRVIALEEVVKYQQATAFLAKEFDLIKAGKSPALFCHGRTNLYDDLGFRETFDYIIFPGVLYHLSDPLLALRILFNALVDGGELYLETAVKGNELAGPVVSFESGKGNNWFVPNDWALSNMVKTVGFEDVQLFPNRNRTFLKAVRTEWKPMLKAGLSKEIR